MVKNAAKKLLFDFFYKYKLKTKLILTYSLVVIIPIIVMGIFLTSSIYNMTIKDKAKTANVALEQTKGNMISKLLRQKAVIDTLLSDRDFMNYLNTYYEDNFSSLTDYIDNIMPIFERFDTGGKEFIVKFFQRTQPSVFPV